MSPYVLPNAPAPPGTPTPIRDLKIGRLGLPTVLDPITEALGSEVQAVGEATAVGQRRAKMFTLTFPIHGTQGDADWQATGNRMRRQLRSMIQNHQLRLGGIYVQFVFDPERNGWLVIGTGELSDDTGGPTFGEYKLSLNQVFRVAAINTHREGFRVDLTDLRLSTSPIDYFGQVIGAGVGFAGLSALALTPLPVGATDASVLDAPISVGQRIGSSGTAPVATGRGSGDVISWERAEGTFNLGDVVIYDRRGNTTALPSP